MPSIVSTLSLARRALLAQQGAMAVAGNNIANVNTPGYARRRAVLQTTPGLTTMNGYFGGGVDLTNVRSLRDVFIEQQFRRELGQSGWHDSGQQQLEMIEMAIGDLGDTGLGAVFDRFWNSWHDLAADPTSTGARSIVRETGRSVVTRLRTVNRNLTEQEGLIKGRITSKIDRINEITSEIAELNRYFVRSGVNVSNELDDRRTVLLDELSRIAGAEYRIEENGLVSVFIGGVTLVERTANRVIEYGNAGEQINLTIAGGNEEPFEIFNGEIGALQGVIEDEITEVRRRLDELAVTLASEVNRVHRNGYGLDEISNRNFFDPAVTGIADLAIDDEIESNLSAIAASANGVSGDNQVALAIAELQDSRAIANGNQTMGDALRATVAWIGARVAESEVNAEGSRLVLDQLAAWRDSVSAVSIDEEMAEMVKLQHAYTAAAKIVNTVNSMFDTIFSII